MPHAVSMPSPGLQALILCGPGSSFPTFTANPDENPKALLPIANRPMVWYPIDFCYRMGITNITLVCPPSAQAAITSGLNTNPYLTSLPLPRPDILTPKDLDLNTGTAEILRLPELRAAVTSDFIVLPCDLVCELGGDKLLQAWMVKAASLPNILGQSSSALKGPSPCSGGLGVWYETKTSTLVKGEETDFIATTPLPDSAVSLPKGSLLSHLSNLVYSMPTDSLKDFTEERKGLPIRHGLLRAHPRVRMLRTHRDAHLYIFPRWVMDFIKENDRLENISEDVLGWWAKAGWQAGLAEKLGLAKVLQDEDHGEDDDDPMAASISSQRIPGSDEPRQGGSEPSTPARQADRATGAVNQDIGKSTTTVPTFLAYVHPSQTTDPLIRRVDTSQLLLTVSLQLAKVPSLEEATSDAPSPFAHAKKVAYPEGVKPRTTITRQDCLIAENVTVEEKTSIKETVVGFNCQINEGAKLFQCLLMEGAVVGKNCKLTKCILGKRCVIGDGSVLTNCEIQENLLVEARTEDKDNKLMSSEGLEATEAEMEEVLQEMDDEVMAVNEEAVV